MVPLRGFCGENGWKAQSTAVAPFLLSLLVIPFLGFRLASLGIVLGFLILCLPLSRRGIVPWVQGLAAIGAAVGLGFRIPFLTDPVGGVLGLGGFSIPFTLLWGMAVLGLREGLRVAAPRPALQLAIDLLLTGDAVLLFLVFPGALDVPAARALVLLLVAMSLWGALAARGRQLVTVHRAVAFGLVLYGISGMTKGAISLFLVAPLAMIGLPMMTASPAFLAGGAAAPARPVPRLLARWRVTHDTFVLSFLVLVSAFVLGGVVSATRSTTAGLGALVVVPLLWGVHHVGPRLRTWLHRPWVGRRPGHVDLLGVRFDAVDLRDAAARVERMLVGRSRGHVVVTPNSLSLLRARRDRSLRAAYERADLVLADGIGVVWASRLLGTPLPERVTGVDLAERVVSAAARSGARVFLLGGRPGVAQRAASRLAARFPGLSIVGTHHGYFTDDVRVRTTLEAACPDLLFVGMGVPRQERFMATAAQTLRIPVMVGLGGTLDLFAGDCRRAPRSWQRLGLEWLYRIGQQPRRIGVAWGIARFILAAGVARVVLSLQNLLSLPEET